MNGNSIEAFFGNVLYYTLLYGEYWIAYDKTTTLVDPQPYLYTIKPKQILYYFYDKTGQISFISILECEEQKPILQGNTAIIEDKLQYRVWDNGEPDNKDDNYIFLYDDEGNKIDEIENPYGFIPIERSEIDDRDINDYGESILRDIIYISDYITHLYSIITKECDRTVPILTLPTGEETELMEKQYEKTVGGQRSFTFANVGEIARSPVIGDNVYDPKFLSPSTDGITVKQEFIEHLIDIIFKISNLGGNQAVEEAGGSSSGIAMGYKLIFTSQYLAKISTQMEKVEENVMNGLFKVMGIDDQYTYIVEYPTDFQIKDNEETTAYYAELLTVMAKFPEFKDFIYKKIANLNSPSELHEKFDTEVTGILDIENQAQQNISAGLREIVEEQTL